MKRRLIITDFTRMKEGRVCVFGVDENYTGIRLELPLGVTEDYAIKNKLEAFNEVEFEFIAVPKPNAKPPHVEDSPIDIKYPPRFIRTLSEVEKKELLEKILDECVEDIFGTTVHENAYLNEGEGKRSIGTIRPSSVLHVEYSSKEDKSLNYRMSFTDSTSTLYDLPVTDLRFRYYCDCLSKNGLETGVISAELSHHLKNSETYLRIGLGRPFKEKENRCYLLVTGIYSFPDYKRDLYEKHSPTHKESKEGVVLADKYAELKAKEAEFKRWYEQEYERIKKELVTYVRRENVGYIDGSDSRVVVKITEVFRFPETRTQDRHQLEQELKNRGFWGDVSMLNIRLLDSGLRGDKFNKELEGILEEYAKKEESTIIRLIRLRELDFSGH